MKYSIFGEHVKTETGIGYVFCYKPKMTADNPKKYCIWVEVFSYQYTVNVIGGWWALSTALFKYYEVVDVLNLGIKIHELDDGHLGLLGFRLLVSVLLLDGERSTAC